MILSLACSVSRRSAIHYHYQYYRLQDNLVDVLLTTVQSYQNSAQREHKDLRYAQRAQRNQLLKAMLGFMKEQLVSPLRAIRVITEQPQLSDAEKVALIRALLAQHDEQRLATLHDEVATELSDDAYCSILEARSVRIQNRMSPILKENLVLIHSWIKALRVYVRCWNKSDVICTGFLSPTEQYNAPVKASPVREYW